MYVTEELMQIGKLTLEIEKWDWGNVLQFSHEEIQQDPWYGNETVETEISVEKAKQLVKHLNKFIEDSEVA